MITFSLMSLVLMDSAPDASGAVILVVIGFFLLIILSSSSSTKRRPRKYCPYCGKQMKYPELPSGSQRPKKPVRCPHCRQII